MASCKHKNPKEANFCSSCGAALKVQVDAGLEIRPVPNLEAPFGKIDKHLASEIELVEATEIIQIVRRPDENMEIDVGDLDPDTAIALMAKGFVQFVVGELMELYEFEEDEEGEEEG